MASEKPFSPASERNRDPILEVLRVWFADRKRVLEIGSGTGQHAVHFAAAMPWLLWQCSDRAEYLPGIRAWLDEAGLPNTPAPIELDVASERWQLPSLPLGRLPPLPLAGEGWGEGALDLGVEEQGQDQKRPHPASGRLLPQAGEVKKHAGQDPDRFDARLFDAVFSANTLHIMGWHEVEAFFAGLGTVLAEAASVVVYGPFNYDGDYTSDSNREFDGWLKARDPLSGIRDFEAVDALVRGIGLRLIADIAMPANNRCLVWRSDRHTKPT
jgi:SAM-dependent methyltransferase